MLEGLLPKLLSDIMTDWIKCSNIKSTKEECYCRSHWGNKCQGPTFVPSTAGSYKEHHGKTSWTSLKPHQYSFLQDVADRPGCPAYKQRRPAATNSLVDQALTMEAWLQN